MYKLLLTLFTFISVSMVANSQVSMDISSTDYNKWFFTNQGGNGVSSYYAQVTTDGNKSSDGLYYYNIYFYTNSRWGIIT